MLTGMRHLSLKALLGGAAALLGAGTVVTSAILYLGFTEVGERLDAALAAEARMARYASLSSQAAGFLVVATEAIQTGQSPETRAQRLAPVADQLRRTFDQIQKDVARSVDEARDLGIDAQSRQGTQSLGLARMQALLEATLEGLGRENAVDNPAESPARLRAHVDGFASTFDPLLSQAVNSEILLRNQTLAGIDTLRQKLILTALIIAFATICLVVGLYFGLIRPQLRRLEALQQAAQRIGREEFDVVLPVSRPDEIGLLSAETNRMAAALQTRKTEVQAEWARLNETIEDRTRELRKANTALEEIDANRRRFFADISHELRTPLTVILMEAQLGQKSTANSAAAFATIEARTSRLNRRIDDLLRVARSDSGQLALDPKAVPLGDLMRAILSDIRADVDSAGMDLELGEVPDIEILCDANWARQVIVGLVHNVIRHARDGTTLRILAEEDHSHAGLAVIDNGPGIAAEDQAHVFDRFTQGKTGASQQGFGVGLALARWVVEAQDGTIALTSPLPREQAIGPAKGTKISVRFPRVTEVTSL